MNDLELLKFAEKVERLCKRLVQHMPPGKDRDKLQDLADEAADWQTKSPVLLSAVLFDISEELK